MESLLDGFDRKKYIADFFKDEYSIKDLMDILSAFVLQVAKKIATYILQQSMFYPIFLNPYCYFFCKYVRFFYIIPKFKP